MAETGRFTHYSIVEEINGTPTLTKEVGVMSEMQAIEREINLKRGQRLVFTEEWTGKRKVKNG